MGNGRTLLDAIRGYPRQAIAAATFAVVFAISRNAMVAGIIAAAIFWKATKTGWAGLLASDSEGYVDRAKLDLGDIDERPEDERYEAMPRYGEITSTALDAEEEAEDAWIAPPEPTTVPTRDIRPPAERRYGIAVPPKKPVDVPRR